MTIQQFIERAIEGGWKEQLTESMPTPHIDTEHEELPRVAFYHDEYPEDGAVIYTTHEILLDPEAWKAVGKVDGWAEAVCVGCGASNIKDCPCEISHEPVPETMELWLYNMHRMIDALAEGKTIEEFLATLTS